MFQKGSLLAVQDSTQFMLSIMKLKANRQFKLRAILFLRFSNSSRESTWIICAEQKREKREEEKAYHLAGGTHIRQTSCHIHLSIS